MPQTPDGMKSEVFSVQLAGPSCIYKKKKKTFFFTEYGIFLEMYRDITEKSKAIMEAAETVGDPGEHAKLIQFIFNFNLTMKLV